MTAATRSVGRIINQHKRCCGAIIRQTAVSTLLEDEAAMSVTRHTFHRQVFLIPVLENVAHFISRCLYIYNLVPVLIS